MREVNRTPRVHALYGLSLAVIVAVKLMVLWQLKDHPLAHPDAGLDTTAYVNLARRVAAGDIGLGPGLYYVSPFYIYFLATTLTLLDSFTAVRVAQAGFGTLAVASIFVTARVWFGTRAAWIAAALAAGTGLFTFYEVLILQSSLDAVLASTALAALAWGLHGPPASAYRRTALAVAGLIFGLGVLNRPNMLVGALAVVLAAVLVRRWRAALLLTLGLLAGLSPVLVRNLVVAGEFSLVSSHGGLNFYIGNHAGATGFYREVPGIRPLIEGQAEDTRRVASAALGREVSDNEASAYFRRLATDWIRAEPAAALALFVRKLFFVFHAQHVALPHSYPFFAYDAGSLLRFLPIGPWLLVPVGLAGLLVAVRDRRAGSTDQRAAFVVWSAFIPGYACGIAIFFVAERYRLALLVPLCVTAGAMIEWLWRQVRHRSRQPLAVPAAALAVLAVATNWPMPFLNDGRWDEGLRLAQRLVITGDYAGADAWVERLERSAARPGRAHHGVGMQLVAQDQPARALTHLRQSLAKGFASADDPEIWLRLGRLAARTEGPASADPLFRRAVALAPAQATARQQHGLNLLVLNRLEEASGELREAVRLDPADVDSLAHLAYCEIKLGAVEKAREHIRAALALKPDDALARQLAAALRMGP